MLAKNNRIVKDKDIKTVLRFNKRFSNVEGLNIMVNFAQLQDFKLLVTISKKIHKKANKRNLLRRRIHAIFEQIKAEKTIQIPKIYFMITIKDKNLAVNYPFKYTEIKESFEKFLNSILKSQFDTPNNVTRVMHD